MKKNHYQSIISEAPFGYAFHEVIFDNDHEPVDYRFIEVNKAFDSIVGMAASHITGKTIRELMPDIENSAFNWIKFYGDIAENGGSEVFERYCENLERWFKVHAFSSEQGFFSTIFIDISKEKESIQKHIKLEQSLSKTGEMYRSLFEQSIEGIYLHDLQGNIIDVNKVATVQSGYSRKELRGMRVFDLHAEPSDPDDIIRQWHEWNPDHRVKIETAHKKKDGKVYPVEISTGIVSYEDTRSVLAIVQDITERKRAEKMLRDSEERYRLLMENSIDAILLTKPDGSIITANKQACEIFGMSIKEIIAAGRNGLVDTDDPRLIPLLKQRERDGFAKGTLHFFRKDGTLFPAEVSSVIYYDSAGERMTSMVIKDQTELRKAEQLLREHDRRLSSMTGNLPGFVYRCKYDEHWTMIQITEKCKQITGYEPEDLINNRTIAFNELILPGYRDPIFREWERCMQKRVTFEYEYQILTADQETRWVFERGNPIFEDGRLLFLEGYIEDITKRKHQEILQKILFEVANASMVTSDFNLLIKTIKDRLSQLIDIRNFYIALYDESSDMLSIPYESDEIDHIERWPAARSATGLVVRTKQSMLLKKTDILRLIDSGKIDQIGYICEVWLGVPLLKNDRPIGAIVMQDYHNPDALGEDSKDILEFVSNHISLSIQRQQAFEDLKISKEKAEESDKLKSAFLANVSHEIRTPMNGILGFLDLIKSTSPDASQMDKYIEIMNRSGQRLLSTINDIIEISKIESGQIDILFEKVNIEDVMHYHLEFFRQHASAKGLKLFISEQIRGGNALVITDRFKLEGILTNLMNNAIKFTREGGIEFGNFLKDDMLTFFVKDSGSGIPEERLQTIFERFMHVDLSFSRPQEGSGLGLPIAKAYAERMGGKVWVESQPGLGSTFFFSIPYTPFGFGQSPD